MSVYLNFIIILESRTTIVTFFIGSLFGVLVTMLVLQSPHTSFISKHDACVPTEARNATFKNLATSKNLAPGG